MALLTRTGAGNVTWQATGGGGGGASVTISDTAPAASPGDLWWESDTGRLKIRYQDTDSTQWVDVAPPLTHHYLLMLLRTATVLLEVLVILDMILTMFISVSLTIPGREQHLQHGNSKYYGRAS